MQDELNEVNEVNRDILVRLLEYCKYLYEEEKERTNRLNDAVKVYIAFLTFILGVGAFKILTIDKLQQLLKNSPTNRTFVIFGVVLFAISVLAFFTSFVFTILILRIWRFERLSNPRKISIKATFMENQNDLLSVIIADYIVACDRNHNINNNKASFLSRALFFLITGLVFLVISLLIISSVSLWGGSI